MAVRFESDRLIARELETGDAEAMFEIYRDPDVWKWLGGGSAYTEIAEAEAAVARQIERYKTEPESGRWAVVVRDTGKMIGTILIVPLEEGPEIEIGYILGKSHWGQGYGTEICRAAIEYGFRTRPVDHLVGVVFPDNLVSQSVLTKSGMTFQGMRHTFGFDLRYYTIERPSSIPKPPELIL